MVNVISGTGIGLSPSNTFTDAALLVNSSLLPFPANLNAGQQFTNYNTGRGSGDGFRIGLTYVSSVMHAGLNSRQTGASMNFRTSDTRRMTISAAGNVGIGTSSPVTLPDVNGNITAKRIIPGAANEQIDLLVIIDKLQQQVLSLERQLNNLANR